MFISCLLFSADVNYGEYSTDTPLTIFDMGDWLFDLLDNSKCPMYLPLCMPLLQASGLVFYPFFSRCLRSKPVLQWWLVPNVWYRIHMLVCGTLRGQKVSERSGNPQKVLSSIDGCKMYLL